MQSSTPVVIGYWPQPQLTTRWNFGTWETSKIRRASSMNCLMRKPSTQVTLSEKLSNSWYYSKWYITCPDFKGPLVVYPLLFTSDFFVRLFRSVSFNLFIIVTAYFNPLDCSKLLTTDQYDQVRVYSSSDWSKPQCVIQHPHRQFQHLTPIKVCLSFHNLCGNVINIVAQMIKAHTWRHHYTWLKLKSWVADLYCTSFLYWLCCGLQSTIRLHHIQWRTGLSVEEIFSWYKGFSIFSLFNIHQSIHLQLFMRLKNLNWIQLGVRLAGRWTVKLQILLIFI